MGFFSKLFNRNENNEPSEKVNASTTIDNLGDGQPQDAHAPDGSSDTSEGVVAYDFLDRRSPLFLLPNHFQLGIGMVRDLASAGDEQARNFLAYHGLEEDHTIMEVWGELTDALTKNDGTFNKMFNRIYHCCKLGHPESLYIIGYCYINGLFVEKDFNEGWQMLQESCEAGCAEAMNEMGLCWRRSGEYDKAFPYFQRAAELGDAQGLHNLGNAYFYSWGVERDDKKAHELWQKAAALGNPDSYCTLGNSYFTGTQTEQNIPEAIRCYTYAATHECNSQEQAIGKLVTVYRMIGDEEKAREWEEKLQQYKRNNVAAVE